jgi:hypothetical protein
MKAAKIKNYESILQVLGDTGCLFCSFMKTFQTCLMQETAQKQIQHLCNFHTWGIAASHRVVIAVQLFRDLLAKQPATQASMCDIYVCFFKQRKTAAYVSFSGVCNTS